MSHFTVMVLGPDPEGQLAPFDESLKVEERAIDADVWWMDGEYTPEEALVAYGQKFDEPFPGYISNGKLVELSTYNLDSKWDYYRLGGGWSPFLKLKDGNTADSATAGEVDWEGMRKDAVDEAEARWAEFEEITAGREFPDVTWLDIDHEMDEFRNGREAYWADPLVRDLREMCPIALPHEVFAGPKGDYLERARLRAVATYATLHHGRWVAPGEMGWFGCSSETADEEDEHVRWVNETIDTLPHDTLVSVYDCHI